MTIFGNSRPTVLIRGSLAVVEPLGAGSRWPPLRALERDRLYAGCSRAPRRRQMARSLCHAPSR
jgi:hypothetical protein